MHSPRTNRFKQHHRSWCSYFECRLRPFAKRCWCLNRPLVWCRKVISRNLQAPCAVHRMLESKSPHGACEILYINVHTAKRLRVFHASFQAAKNGAETLVTLVRSLLISKVFTADHCRSLQYCRNTRRCSVIAYARLVMLSLSSFFAESHKAQIHRNKALLWVYHGIHQRIQPQQDTGNKSNRCTVWTPT